MQQFFDLSHLQKHFLDFKTQIVSLFNRLLISSPDFVFQHYIQRDCQNFLVLYLKNWNYLSSRIAKKICAIASLVIFEKLPAKLQIIFLE